MDGVIRDGRHAGGRAYGHRAIPGSPCKLEIVEHEANVVRQIFADYVGGSSPRDIAASLNRSGIKPPRGATWNASTINGNLQRGAGLLLNEIYIGRIVWNRVRMIKGPSTGRPSRGRIRRTNSVLQRLRICELSPMIFGKPHKPARKRILAHQALDARKPCACYPA
jgi:hypothetical protein